MKFKTLNKANYRTKEESFSKLLSLYNHLLKITPPVCITECDSLYVQNNYIALKSLNCLMISLFCYLEELLNKIPRNYTHRFDVKFLNPPWVVRYP